MFLQKEVPLRQTEKAWQKSAYLYFGKKNVDQMSNSQVSKKLCYFTRVETFFLAQPAFWIFLVSIPTLKKTLHKIMGGRLEAKLVHKLWWNRWNIP